MQNVDLSKIASILKTKEAPRYSSVPYRVFPRNYGTAGQKINDQVQSFLERSGLDLTKINEEFAKEKVAFEQAITHAKSHNLKRLESLKGGLRSFVDRRRKLAEYVAAQYPNYVYLSTPFLIWARPANFLVDSSAQAFQAWAKVALDTNQDTAIYTDAQTFDPGRQVDFTFYFFWQNPTPYYAVVNVDAWLALIGTVTIKSYGGTASGARYSDMHVTTQLNIMEWWNQPPTEVYPAPEFEIWSDSTSTGGWFSKHDTKSLNLLKAYDFHYDLLLIPPNGSVVFEITTAFYYHLADGWVTIDFATGDFQAYCPYVQLTLLTAPAVPKLADMKA